MPKRARVPVNKKGDRNLTYPSQHPIHLPLYKKRGVGGTIRIQPGILKKNAPPGDFHFVINKRFQLFAAKITYATEQGIFRGVSGKIFQGTGNFHARSPDASILNFEQPQRGSWTLGSESPPSEGNLDPSSISPTRSTRQSLAKVSH